MNQINWGIIGCGDVTEAKSGPAFNQIEGSRLVAVMRRDGEKARDYAQRHGVPKWYDAADALIGDPDVNAVYIATPPDAHEDYTRRVAQAGKPVYVEKPMARSFNECTRMIAACEKAGVPLFVAFYRRRLPRFLTVQRLLQDGAIGAPRAVTVTLHQPPIPIEPGKIPWRVVPAIAGGGLFVDLAAHTLDVLDYLLGPIRGVTGTASNEAGLYEAEDVVKGVWQHESGVTGAGDWNFNASDRLDRVQIIGETGAIELSTFGQESVRLLRGGATQEFDGSNPSPVQGPLIQTVVDALRGAGECPSTGVSGARTNRVMDEMLRSWRERSGVRFE